jgi:hypothetical protein
MKVQEPIQVRQQKLIDLLGSDDLVVSGSLDGRGISIYHGANADMPLVRINRTSNPRNKCPIGVLDINGQYVIVNYLFGDEINDLRTMSREEEELDLLDPINGILASEYGARAIAWGLHGARFTNDDQFKRYCFGIGSKPIFYFEVDKPNGPAVTVRYRKMTYYVSMEPHVAANDSNFEDVAVSVTPTVASYRYKAQTDQKQYGNRK